MNSMFIFFIILPLLSILFYCLFKAGVFYWRKYRERVVEETSRSMEDIFLVMPPEKILRIAVASSLSLFIVLTFVFNILFGLLGLIAGFLTPRLALMRLKQQRHKKFEQQLAEGLETIANALKTGYSLPQAIDLLVKDGMPPISQEFALAMNEYRLGIPIDRALEKITGRVKSENLELMVNAVRTLRKTGGNLVEIFNHISYVISERQRVQGRIDVLTAQGKMEALIVGLMPFFLLLVINAMSPDLVAPLFTTFIGWILLLGVVVMDIIGVILIMKIVNIEI
jgi:tight adherence protein B